MSNGPIVNSIAKPSMVHFQSSYPLNSNALNAKGVSWGMDNYLKNYVFKKSNTAKQSSFQQKESLNQDSIKYSNIK